MLYPAVMPADGVIAAMDVLSWYLQRPAAAALVHLYMNVLTPTPATIVGDFVEATAGGLAGQFPGIPTQVPITPYGRSVWLWPRTVWTSTGPGLPQICYGYWLDYLDPLTSARRLGWCQRFQTAVGVFAAGQTVSFTLSLGGQQIP
jgi:hypothetical protein